MVLRPRRPAPDQVEGDVRDHVLLAADQLAAADLDQDGAGVQAVPGGGGFGVAEEAGVDAGVAEGEGFAVDPDLAVLEGAYEVVGGVHEREQVAAVLPAHEVGDGDERLQGAVAGSRALTGERGIDPYGAVLHGGDGVGHAQGEVVVSVDAQLGGRVEDVAIRAEAVADAVHREAAAGVGDVDAVRAEALHQLGLAGEFGGLGHVGHHQEPGDVHAQFAGGGDVLGGDVGLGAVGGDAHRADPEGVGLLEVVQRADAGEQECGGHGLVGGARDRLDPLPVGVGADAVVDAGAGQSVAVGDLDGGDPGGVQGGGDGTGLLDGVAVPHGVHAVAQGDVLDVQRGRGGFLARPGGGGVVGAHRVAPSVERCAAMRSAVRSAAEVMMSRFPAYAGR